MNILVIQESDWIQRNPHQQHHLMERLSLKGHNIRVIDYEVDWRDGKNNGLISKRKVFKNVHKIHKKANIDVIRPTMVKIPILNYFSWILSNWGEINRQIIEFKPDVIVGFGLINTYLASKIAKNHKLPFVYYVIDVLYTLIPEKIFRIMGRELKKRIIRNSDLVITINKSLSEFVIDLGANENRTMIIDAGINFELFNLNIDGSNIRKEYGVKANDILLFFMGWIYHFAGLKEVSEEIGKQNYENMKLMVVGDGDAYKDIKRIIDKYNINEKIVLTGKKPYELIPEYIAAADVCILPAYTSEETMQEIVPIKIYEYMAMGKPVIATKLRGLMNEFGENNGIVYVDNSKDVIGKVMNIDLEINGKIARNFIEKNDWESIVNRFEKTLLELLKN